jgi:plasmid stabilization system protein ParE
MKRYRIEFSDDAKNDIMRSYEWGREKWGLGGARRWYQDLRQQTRKLLTHFPLAQPLAPESEEVVGEIRTLIFGRYRILFEIIGDTVRVLHVRGAFIDNEIIDLGANE